MTYSLDLRKRVLAFGITLRTLVNWIRREREGLLPLKPRRSAPSLMDSQKLRDCIQKHPDAYLREIAEEFGSTPQGIFYAWRRLKISLKKTCYYKERDEEKRRQFIEKISMIPEKDQVYLDESGINQYLRRERELKEVSKYTGLFLE